MIIELVYDDRTGFTQHYYDVLNPNEIKWVKETNPTTFRVFPNVYRTTLVKSDFGFSLFSGQYTTSNNDFNIEI